VESFARQADQVVFRQGIMGSFLKGAFGHLEIKGGINLLNKFDTS